jgi:CHAT domain
MTELAPTYDELTIRIRPGEGNSYRTVVSAPDGAVASGAFVLPFSETELDNFVLRVGRQRLPVRSYRSTQMQEAKEFGARLFNALMVDEVRDVFRAARAVADQSHKGLRVTLCLTDAPELMDVPWEFLYERPRFLAQSIYSPVVRSLDLTEVPAPYPLNLPLSVLGMVSSPRGFDTLDVGREKEKLATALEPLCSRGLVTIDWLERSTLRTLDDAISRNPEINVFHYIGHGAYDPLARGGILVLEDENGGPHEVTGDELGLLLQDERSLRLAVLNSCEGARSSHLDPFSGFASALVQYGIPAVIGMQFEITDQAAIAFAARLYSALAQSYPVDAALAQSRRSIFAAGNDIEFGTPVLFLRGADAHLFEIMDAYPPPPPEPEPEPEPETVDYLVEEWEEPSNVLVKTVPRYLSWLPKPWQEWLLEATWNPGKTFVKALSRIPNRTLAFAFVVLLIAGVLVTTLFGEENADGQRESTLGAILLLIGLLGLAGIIYRAAADRFRRLRDWWTK